MRASITVLAASIALATRVAAAAPCVDAADETEPCHSGFAMYLDNDVLLFDQDEDEDRNYTMGLSFQSSGRWIETRGLAKPLYWLDALPPFKHLRPSYAATASEAQVLSHAMELGNVAFTPDELRLARPIPNDRPYASLLFLDTRWQAVEPGMDPRNAFTSELSIGVLGLSISERFQRWLHKQLQDSPNDPPFPPRGWDNQISDGGEPTARYTMRWQHAAIVREHVDWQWIGEGNLGYHTNVGGGAALRVGWIASPWWRFETTPIAQAEAVPAVANAAPRPAAHGGGCSNRKGDFELFAWAGSMARLWGYNVLLQGQFRDSTVTVDSSDVERFVYDYSLGTTAGKCFGDHWHSLTVAYARRSPEFDGPMRRYHSWGGIYYSIAF
jgi:hypothetical protein